MRYLWLKIIIFSLLYSCHRPFHYSDQKNYTIIYYQAYPGGKKNSEILRIKELGGRRDLETIKNIFLTKQKDAKFLAAFYLSHYLSDPVIVKDSVFKLKLFNYSRSQENIGYSDHPNAISYALICHIIKDTESQDEKIRHKLDKLFGF